MSTPVQMSVPPPPASGEKRPCPYCGVWNRLEFSFCEVCGKALPARAAAPAPPPPPPSYVPPPPSSASPAVWQAAPDLQASPWPASPAAVPAPPGPESVDASMEERPLTEAEAAHLRGLMNHQNVRLPRFLAGFMAFLSLGMIGMGFLGLPFLPTEFSVIVFTTGFLSALLGGVSQKTRGPVLRVLARGVVRDVWGVPAISSGQGIYTSVRLAGIDFLMPKAATERLLAGRMNRIAYVDSGSAKGRSPVRGYLTAWLVDANGVLESPPRACLVSESTGKVPSPPGAPAMPTGMGGFR